MRARGGLRGVGTLAIAVGLGLALPVPAQAAFPGGNGRIAFTTQARNRGEPVWSRIETVLPSGRGRRTLSTCPAAEGCFDSDPTWSPGGGLVAFVQGDTGRDRLLIARHDGKGLRRLPQLTQNDGEPAWSPDGRRLAFIGEGPRLYTVRRDGTALRQVTPRYAVSPAWSLEGRIAFVHDDLFLTRHDDGIYTIRPDGSRLRPVIHEPQGPGPPEVPDWSPHASRIAFAVAGSVNPEVHVANAAGRMQRRLTRHGTDPAWSPDGKYIAFIRDWDLYVMRSDGGGIRRVVDGGSLQGGEPLYLSSPSWQPLRR